MKIKTRHINRKLLTITPLVLVLVVGGYFVYAHQQSLWPFDGSGDAAHNDSTLDAQPANSRPDNDSARIDTEDTPKPTDEDSDESSDNDFVSTPISNPPTVNDPYPIQNDHYKISQISATEYDIVLYPIVNSPDSNSYQAQLRAYKREALQYLERRYGDISSFSINWSPKDAQDV